MAIESLQAHLYAFVICQVNAFLGASDGQTAGNSADIIRYISETTEDIYSVTIVDYNSNLHTGFPVWYQFQ